MPRAVTRFHGAVPRVTYKAARGTRARRRAGEAAFLVQVANTYAFDAVHSLTCRQAARQSAVPIVAGRFRR